MVENWGGKKDRKHEREGIRTFWYVKKTGIQYRMPYPHVMRKPLINIEAANAEFLYR